MKKILIIKSSSMGDIIHALPVAHDIRQALPDARIDWVAEESFADIPPLAPAVEKVYVTAFRRWRNSPFSVKTRREVSALKAELQAEHYDIVIDIQGLIRSGLVARWTKAPTVGYTRQTIREPLAAFFYQQHLDLPEALGAVKRYRIDSIQYDYSFYHSIVLCCVKDSANREQKQILATKHSNLLPCRVP